MPRKAHKDPEKVANAYKGLMAKQKTSPKRKLIEADYQKWVKNTLIFLVPALIVFLTALLNGATLQQASVAIYLWLLNSTIDLLKKWVAENTYVQK